MKLDIGRFHNRAKVISAREHLPEYKQKVVSFVLDSKGRTLTEGWNSYTKSHPAQKAAALKFDDEFKCFIHSEVASLVKLKRSQLGRQDSIVIMRLGSTQNLLPSKPCRICESVIKQYGITNIIHS